VVEFLSHKFDTPGLFLLYFMQVIRFRCLSLYIIIMYIVIPDDDCGVLYNDGCIWLWLMLSVVVFRTEGGSEITNVPYTLIFVAFVSLMVLYNVCKHIRVLKLCFDVERLDVYVRAC
jgi:hypothetical protein